MILQGILFLLLDEVHHQPPAFCPALRKGSVFFSVYKGSTSKVAYFQAVRTRLFCMSYTSQ